MLSPVTIASTRWEYAAAGQPGPHRRRGRARRSRPRRARAAAWPRAAQLGLDGVDQRQHGTLPPWCATPSSPTCVRTGAVGLDDRSLPERAGHGIDRGGSRAQVPGGLTGSLEVQPSGWCAKKNPTTKESDHAHQPQAPGGRRLLPRPRGRGGCRCAARDPQSRPVPRTGPRTPPRPPPMTRAPGPLEHRGESLAAAAAAIGITEDELRSRPRGRASRSPRWRRPTASTCRPSSTPSSATPPSASRRPSTSCPSGWPSWSSARACPIGALAVMAGCTAEVSACPPPPRPSASPRTSCAPSSGTARRSLRSPRPTTSTCSR